MAHLSPVARPQMAPATQDGAKREPNSARVIGKVILPVSRLMPIGIDSAMNSTAVDSGRRSAAHRSVAMRARRRTTRQTVNAASHGSVAHGTNNGSPHGA